MLLLASVCTSCRRCSSRCLCLELNHLDLQERELVDQLRGELCILLAAIWLVLALAPLDGRGCPVLLLPGYVVIVVDVVVNNNNMMIMYMAPSRSWLA